MTIEQAAVYAELDRTTLGRIEKGEVPYDQDLLERLSIPYGCTVADLLTVDPTKGEAPDVLALYNGSPSAVQAAVIAALKATRNN
jgi:transcriptional regulator with XRE-family HTH domain